MSSLKTISPTPLILLGFFTVVVGIRLSIIAIYGDAFPYWDDYEIGKLLHLYQTGTIQLADIFVNANEHRLVFNRLISILFFEANQHQWDPRISMVFNSLLWGLTGVFLLRLCIRELSSAHAMLPIAAIVVFWCFPIALVNVIWGVQTHTYTMLMFSVLGCWYISSPLISRGWWFGLLCLMCAPLTLSGGTFASFAVAGVALLMAVKQGVRIKQHSATFAACLIVGLIGLSLILIQPRVDLSEPIQITNAATTFLKTMSWPLISQVWPSLIFALPIALLFYQEFFKKESVSRVAQFTFSLFGFLLLLALATGYARGDGGFPPARRYFDYLSLIPITSLMALAQIELRPTSAVARTWLAALLAGLLLTLAAGVPSLIQAFVFTVQDNAFVKEKHRNLVLSYLNTRDDMWLFNRGFRGIPYPNEKLLKQALDDMNQHDILPYVLQTPAPLTFDYRWSQQQIQDSPFIVNGTFKATTREFSIRPFQQDVFGSFKPRDLGAKAIGVFESTEFYHNRDAIAVPVTGFFGYPDMSIKFVDVGSGEEFPLSLPEVGDKNSEQWFYVIQKLKKGYYKLVAEDSSATLWFGFATPKSVGRWSYRVEWLLANARWVWLFGLMLLLLGARKPLERLLADR